MTEKFTVWQFQEEQSLLDSIQACSEKKHFQQVAFSTYGKQLTKICFNCQEIIYFKF